MKSNTFWRLSAVLLCSSIILTPKIASANQLINSVVKVFVTNNSMDYYRPWQSVGVSSSTGSGGIISGNRILTNAHVVSDQTFIQVKKYGDPRKYTARLLAIGHDCDLALLTVDDPKFFEDTTPLELGELPKLQDQVIVLGYPQGGEKLSITEGVISRIEVYTYSQSARSLLAIQIDAAINPGNSGGPVIFNNKLVGVAMQVLQNGQNIGYMIPIPIVQHFFKDLEDGNYDGFPQAGINYANTENPTLREYYKISDVQGGVLVTKILPHSSAEGVLQKGDVIMKVNNVPIGEDGTFEFRGSERLTMPYLITEKQINEPLDVEIMREGERLQLQVSLNPLTSLVPGPKHFEKPPYYIFGGFVFTVLSTDLLRSWGNKWWEKAPIDLNYYLFGVGRMNKNAHKEKVVLLSVLADDINVGYHQHQREIVESVNGETFKSFEEFVKLLNQSKKENGHTIISTEQAGHIIISNNNLDEIDGRILGRNNIPTQYSSDVAQWLTELPDEVTP